MTDKNYDDISNNEIRVLGGHGDAQMYFCKQFIATCPKFEDTGLCRNGGCPHADANVPSENKRIAMQLSKLRRDQLAIMRQIRIMNKTK